MPSDRALTILKWSLFAAYLVVSLIRNVREERKEEPDPYAFRRWLLENSSELYPPGRTFP